MTRADARRGAASQGPDGSSESGSGAGLRGALAGRSADILFLAALAGLLMLASEFLLVFSIEVGERSCEATASPDVADLCTTTGGERHSYALIVLGLFTLAMAWGATVGASRPAGAALVLVGLVVVGIALLGDLPDAYTEGLVGDAYDAEAAPALGLWVELAGGALAVVAGLLRLTRRS